MNTLPIEVQVELYAKAKELRGKGMSYKSIAEELGDFGTMTVWRWINTDQSPPDNKLRILNLQPRKSLAKFFGCLEGSSYIDKQERYKSKDNTFNYTFCVRRKDKSKIKIVQEITRRILGKKYLIKQEKEAYHASPSKLYFLALSNKHLIEFWRGYEGMPNHYGRPEFKETLEKYPKHFISGVFDTTGYLIPENNILGKKKKKKKSIDLISHALSKVEIPHRIHRKGNWDGYEIVIKNKVWGDFLEKIPLENSKLIKRLNL